jgi:hypothetical protein
LTAVCACGSRTEPTLGGIGGHAEQRDGGSDAASDASPIDAEADVEVDGRDAEATDASDSGSAVATTCFSFPPSCSPCPAGFVPLAIVRTFSECDASACDEGANEYVCAGADLVGVEHGCDEAIACAGGLHVVGQVQACDCDGGAYYVCAK